MRTIYINGQATLSKQPEIIRVTVNVDSKLQKKVAEANQIVDKAIIEIKEYCKTRNIESKQIKLINYNTTNVYETIEKTNQIDDKNSFKTREQVFVGYRTNATLMFEFDFDMKETAIIFEELGNIENITYRMVYALKEPEKYKKEVVAMAVKNAFEMAEVLAIAANSKIIGTEKISYGYDSDEPVRQYEAVYRKAGCRNFESAIGDLGVQDLSIHESVNIIFEIE